MSEQITPADALQTLANAAAQYRGTLQEHQVIQQCVQVLRENNEALEAIKAEQKSKGKTPLGQCDAVNTDGDTVTNPTPPMVTEELA